MFRAGHHSAEKLAFPRLHSHHAGSSPADLWPGCLTGDTELVLCQGIKAAAVAAAAVAVTWPFMSPSRQNMIE